MGATDYSSKRLSGARRPPAIVSAIKVVGALTLLAALVLGLFFLVGPFLHAFRSSEFWFGISHIDQFATALQHAEGNVLIRMLNYCSFLVTSLLVVICLAILTFRITGGALRMFWIGLRELRRPLLPGRIPNDYASPDELYRLFREQTMRVYETADGVMSALFGKGAMFISPAARDTAAENASHLHRRMTVTIRLGLLLILVLWGGDALLNIGALGALDDKTQTLLVAVIDASGLTLLALPIAGLLVLQLLVAGIEYLSTARLIPRHEPSTETLLRTHYYDGFGHPQQLVGRLPDIARELAWNGFQNRVASSGFNEQGSRAVEDTGSFSVTLFIEQQPRPVTSPNSDAAILLLIGGWGLYLAAVLVLVLLLIPPPLMAFMRDLSISTLFLLAPLYVPLMAVVSTRAWRAGGRLLRQSDRFFDSLRFQSEAVLIDLDGVISQANLTVGRARDDSIESSNRVIRSDFTARFRAARLISEVANLHAARIPLSAAPSEDSETWVSTLAAGIEALRSGGVRPLGVDVASPELQRLVELNAAAAALRELGKREPERLAVGSAQLFARKGQGVGGQNSLTSDEPVARLAGGEDDAFKECPTCAEPVRVRARKCRFCGYEFEVHAT
ncbi:zinc ribbon domain-containing protein [uncultured Thiocystis sp.]|jgi:hypothetical protein|uniref:zinc ribbon domain-containing protein n=1 Tax=uncultured Thiocystis sp. TaxID=1202134 RepID=UPI0025DF30B8|nr:zinc ribbon domain-containing protein [uncultured Thiocystis sp.]